MFANRFTALIDACVLASPLKRNLILSLAEAELFRVRWSDEIMCETERAIEEMLTERGYPDATERATRARTAMENAFEDAAVSSYESIADGLKVLPDDKDDHVLAAAIKARADIIVTDNLKDFPAEILSTYGIEPKSADSFIADSIDLSPSVAISAVGKMRNRLRKPEKTAEVLLLDMEKIGLTQTADQLRDSVDLL